LGGDVDCPGQFSKLRGKYIGWEDTDNFAFSILDTNGNPIPTTDTFASTLLNFDLTPGLSASTVSVFQTTQAPVIGPPTVTTPASSVPEPSSLVVVAAVGLCLTGLAAARSRFRSCTAVGDRHAV